MVGLSAKAYRTVGETVRKGCHLMIDDTDITKQKMEA